jgi:hypothetical protein
MLARELGMLFDPESFVGGDGHSKDLWRGPVTASLKTRHSHLPSDFLFPDGQNPTVKRLETGSTSHHPGEFPDDYGIVGRWTQPYVELEVVGYFSYFDWLKHNEWIEVTGVPPGKNNIRQGYREHNLRPIEELVFEIDMVPDEEISFVQSYGYVRYFGDWFRSGRYPIH